MKHSKFFLDTNDGTRPKVPRAESILLQITSMTTSLSKDLQGLYYSVSNSFSLFNMFGMKIILKHVGPDVNSLPPYVTAKSKHFYRVVKQDKRGHCCPLSTIYFSKVTFDFF